MNMNDIESKYTLICERTGNNIKEDISKELAEFLHKEDVTTFSTGFMSNLGIISAIAGRNDVIICDKEFYIFIFVRFYNPIRKHKLTIF